MASTTLEGTQLAEIMDAVRELLTAGETLVTADVCDDGSATVYGENSVIPVGWELPDEDEA